MYPPIGLYLYELPSVPSRAISHVPAHSHHVVSDEDTYADIGRLAQIRDKSPASHPGRGRAFAARVYNELSRASSHEPPNRSRRS